MNGIETFLIIYFTISFFVLTLIVIKSSRGTLPNQKFFDSVGTVSLFFGYIGIMLIAPPVFLFALFRRLFFTK